MLHWIYNLFVQLFTERFLLNKIWFYISLTKDVFPIGFDVNFEDDNSYDNFSFHKPFKKIPRLQKSNQHLIRFKNAHYIHGLSDSKNIIGNVSVRKANFNKSIKF